MKKTPQQIKNLKEALVWWKTVPKKNVVEDLGIWRKPQPEINDPPQVSCDTVACFGGWACLWPGLQAQGLRPAEDGTPQMYAADGSVKGTCWDAPGELFGSSGLFDMRGYRDSSFGSCSDHSLVTKRIKAALSDPEQT